MKDFRTYRSIEYSVLNIFMTVFALFFALGIVLGAIDFFNGYGEYNYLLQLEELYELYK